jgi:mRNA interferase RelE/StbE
MIYKLAFKPSALKEWQALDGTIRNQFKKVLIRRLESPHIASAGLRGMPNCYKIKLKALGYRLVYEVSDQMITVTVIAVGKRERGLVYASSSERLKD